MSIRKNEIPILEFDDNPMAVINPTHENQNISLPPKCVFAFVGGYIDVRAGASCAKSGRICQRNKRISGLCFRRCRGRNGSVSGAGRAAPAVQLLDWLIGYG